MNGGIKENLIYIWHKYKLDNVLAEQNVRYDVECQINLNQSIQHSNYQALYEDTRSERSQKSEKIAHTFNDLLNESDWSSKSEKIERRINGLLDDELLAESNRTELDIIDWVPLSALEPRVKEQPDKYKLDSQIDQISGTPIKEPSTASLKPMQVVKLTEYSSDKE